MPDDLDLRRLRYFVAVAEARHFGRAAATLHVAQPVLSRQIRVLETELGADLFVRDRRGTELTAAGEELLAEARPLLAAAAAARRRVARAAEGAPFTIGFMPGLVLTTVVRELARRRPDLTVDVRRTGWDDQVEVIRDGRVDVGLVRSPLDPRGLVVEPLLHEPRLAVLPADHRLAGKSAVDLADLVDDHLLQDPGALPEWHDLTAGRSSGPAPTLRTVEEKLEHVAAGRGFVVLPRSTAEYYRRTDVAAVPVADIAAGEVALAWRDGRTTDDIRAFAEVVVEHRESLITTP